VAKRKVKVKFAFQPYPLQQEIIDYVYGKRSNPMGDPYRFFVVAIGRQAGKSWLDKYIILDKSVNHGANCMWVAPSYKNARDHWNSLTELIESSGMVKAGVVSKISHAAHEIHFVTGGKIQVRSALEGDNLRGAGLDLLVLDEAAFFRDGNYLWYSVLLPTITSSGGVVLFTTTPNGRNWLYELYKLGQDPNNTYFKSWNAPSTVSPYQDKELLATLKAQYPTLQWREEFMAEFLADGGGVFAGVERAAVSELLSSRPANADESRFIAGIDVGFNNDYTCFTVLDTIERKQVYGERFTDIGTVATVKRIIELLEEWQPKKTYVEKNGVGEHFLDLLKTVLNGGDIADMLPIFEEVEEDENGEFSEVLMNAGNHKLVAIHMDNPKKRNAVERLSVDIEYGRFFILNEDSPYGETQISEMSTYERKHTQSGLNVTYSAAEGSHDDTIAAMYLAYIGMPKKRRKKPQKEQRRNTKVNKHLRGGSTKNLRSYNRRRKHA